MNILGNSSAVELCTVNAAGVGSIPTFPAKNQGDLASVLRNVPLG